MASFALWVTESIKRVKKPAGEVKHYYWRVWLRAPTKEGRKCRSPLIDQYFNIGQRISDKISGVSERRGEWMGMNIAVVIDDHQVKSDCWRRRSRWTRNSSFFPTYHLLTEQRREKSTFLFFPFTALGLIHEQIQCCTSGWEDGIVASSFILSSSIQFSWRANESASITPYRWLHLMIDLIVKQPNCLMGLE